jgi:site-specific DNA-methyltransferase (adenine-specific)
VTVLNLDRMTTVLCCRAIELVQQLEPRSIDLILTDPPFAAATHTGARSLKGGAGPMAPITFSPFTYGDLRLHLGLLGTIAKRWLVVHTDIVWMAALKAQPIPGLEFVRAGAWFKPNGTPQYTGDRPGQGWEAIAILHVSVRTGRMSWNGGGLPATWRCPVDRSRKGELHHPTQKPLALAAQLIREFSQAGDLVLDPFCGAGTTAVAALQLGRRSVAADMDPVWAQRTRDRLCFEGVLQPPKPLRRLKGDPPEA